MRLELSLSLTVTPERDSVVSSLSSSSSSLSSSPKSISNSSLFHSQTVKALSACTSLPLPLCEITSLYAELNPFDAEAWKRVFGVKIDPCEQIELDDEFYAFWSAPDALDPTQPNSKTHFQPILIPQTVTGILPSDKRRLISHIKPTEYSLDVLGELVQTPQEGRPTQIAYPESKTLKQIGKVKAGPAHWIVVRKDLVSKGHDNVPEIKDMRELNEKTHAGYDELPSALDLSTALLVHYVVTGERYLGDKTGMEQRCSESFTRDTVRDTYAVVTEDLYTYLYRDIYHYTYEEKDFNVKVGYYSPDQGLLLSRIDFKATNSGIAGVRPFAGRLIAKDESKTAG